MAAVNWPGVYDIGSNYVSDALFIVNGGELSSQGAILGRYAGGSSNLAVVSGSGSAWTNTSVALYVGLNGAANRLVISNGGTVVVTAADAEVGRLGSSLHNSVLVTGNGSVWRTVYLFLGDVGSQCSLVISNGGAVFSTGGHVGNSGYSNVALVTGSGSIWSNRFDLNVGYVGKENNVTVSNGATLFSRNAYIGTVGAAHDNKVLVTGSGSVWENSGTLSVGYGLGGSSITNNRLIIANGGSVLASNLFVSFSPIRANNNLVHVSSVNLTITNALGNGALDVRHGTLTFDSGTILVDRLWLTNGANSILEFNSGDLRSKGTLISNTQPCVIGDGVGSTTLHLVGGLHSFQNGLRIRANSFLTGCGTINGDVVVDAGGAVHANCTNLVFTGNVTNNGATVVDGAALETFGTFVNNGKIYLLNGGTTNFHGSFINNGQILNGDIHLAIERDGSSGMFIRYIGVPDVTYGLQRAVSVTGPWSDLATNTAPASGLIEYHETALPPGQAYYRTVQP